IYCAAASAQMVLNATPIPNIKPLPTQKALFDSASTATKTITPGYVANVTLVDVYGERSAIQQADPARTYLAYTKPSYDSANRSLAYNLSNYKVPAVAVVNGGGHDVNVFGYESDVQPNSPTAD